MPVRLTSLWVLAFIAVAVQAGCAGCKVATEAYCCTEKETCGTRYRECLPDNPDRPFCDNNGEFPASEGVRGTCIPSPLNGGDGGGGCSSADDCTAEAPVCGPSHQCVLCTLDSDCSRYSSVPHCGGAGACVECRGSADCTIVDRPVCDESVSQCRRCSSDGECDSGICDEAAGACVPEDSIVYVDTTGSLTGTCTKEAPCKTIQLGVDAASAGRSWVHVAAGTYPDRVSINGKTLQIVASGADLTPAQGPGIEVKGAAIVVIEGIRVKGVAGPGAVSCSDGGSGHAPTLTLTHVSIEMSSLGVDADNCALTLRGSTLTGNVSSALSSTGGSVTVIESTVSGSTQGGGIFAQNGSLVVTKTTVSANKNVGIYANNAKVEVSQSRLLGNAGGGATLFTSDFSFVNTIIAKNGASGGVFGGVLIGGNPPSGPLGGKFEFNTVSGNSASTTQSGTGGGLRCQSVSVALAFENNIVYGNTGATQVTGANCSWAYSDVGPDSVSGTGNLNMMPEFVGDSTNDYHLKPGSPGIDAANPAALLSTDIDGDSRPAGGRSDMGADEVP
jgi:hypothetical protein